MKFRQFRAHSHRNFRAHCKGIHNYVKKFLFCFNTCAGAARAAEQTFERVVSHLELGHTHRSRQPMHLLHHLHNHEKYFPGRCTFPEHHERQTPSRLQAQTLATLPRQCALPARRTRCGPENCCPFLYILFGKGFPLHGRIHARMCDRPAHDKINSVKSFVFKLASPGVCLTSFLGIGQQDTVTEHWMRM